MLIITGEHRQREPIARITIPLALQLGRLVAVEAAGGRPGVCMCVCQCVCVCVEGEALLN